MSGRKRSQSRTGQGTENEAEELHPCPSRLRQKRQQHARFTTGFGPKPRFWKQNLWRF